MINLCLFFKGKTFKNKRKEATGKTRRRGEYFSIYQLSRNMIFSHLQGHQIKKEKIYCYPTCMYAIHGRSRYVYQGMHIEKDGTDFILNQVF